MLCTVIQKQQCFDIFAQLSALLCCVVCKLEQSENTVESGAVQEWKEVAAEDAWDNLSPPVQI